MTLQFATVTQSSPLLIVCDGATQAMPAYSLGGLPVVGARVVYERFGSLIAVHQIADQSWTAMSGFSNSFANFGGATDYAAAYYMDAMGWVNCRGLIKNATATQTGAVFTFPAGYRPLQRHIFVAEANAGTPAGFVRLSVVAAGVLGVDSYGASSGAGFISLAGVRFQAEQ